MSLTARIPEGAARPPRRLRRGTTRVRIARTERGRRRELRAGLVIVGLVLALSVLVPIVSSYGVETFGPRLQHPSWPHLFGTDEFGRDIFTRTFAAGRLNLGIAAAGVIGPLAIGTIIGVFAGSAGGVVDAIVMRIVDGIIAIPFVILVLAIVLVVGQQRTLWFLPGGIPALLAAVYATSWAVYARLARGQTLALRNRDYIIAARVIGYSRWRIISRHLFGTVLATTATYAASEAILIVSVTASLAFLGAGVTPPTPEWGSLIYEGRDLLASSWWMSVLPGLVLAFAGFGLALIADAVIDRDAR